MAGAMFETFVINEILKSYSNEGLDYDFDVFYYNGKDKKKKTEDGKDVDVDGEINLIIQENGILYPIEIKLSTIPKASMASAFDVLDGIPDKKRGMGCILCLIDRKLYLRENLAALPLEYLWTIELSNARASWAMRAPIVLSGGGGPAPRGSAHSTPA